MYKSKLYKKFNLQYCKQGQQESNEIFFFKKIKALKFKKIYFFNLVFENISLFFIKLYYKRKRIAKYAEIIPKLLTKNQRLKKTIGFLKKYWKLFSLERHILHKQKSMLYKTIYKNRLNDKWY